MKTANPTVTTAEDVQAVVARFLAANYPGAKHATLSIECNDYGSNDYEIGLFGRPDESAWKLKSRS